MNFTRDDMAYILDTSKNTYRSWERDYGVPPIKTLNKMSNAFGVSLDILLGRKTDQEVISRVKEIRIEKEKKRKNKR
jgi:transcriptional regulator with XRE-family HTH domain